MSPQYDFSAGDEITAVRINTLGTSATPHEISASRAITAAGETNDNWYQNTTGKTIIVLVTVRLTAQSSNTGASVTAKVGVSTPTAIDFGNVKFLCETNDGNNFHNAEMMLTMVVPDDYYYQALEALTGAGSTDLLKWVEITP